MGSIFVSPISSPVCTVQSVTTVLLFKVLHRGSSCTAGGGSGLCPGFWADNNNQPAAASLAQNNFRVLRSPSAPPPPGGPIFCAEMYPELNTFLWRVSARLRLQPGFGWSSFGPGSRFPQI